MKILKFKNKQKYKYNKKIIIKDLILLLSVGVHHFEKQKKQRVKFNIEITTDPNLKPDFKTIVNYESVINDIKKLTKKTHFELLESLSESIFDEVFIFFMCLRILPRNICYVLDVNRKSIKFFY